MELWCASHFGFLCPDKQAEAQAGDDDDDDAAQGQIISTKILLLIAIAIFMLGSALCGAAQDMTWLCICRAVQGIGQCVGKSLP